MASLGSNQSNNLLYENTNNNGSAITGSNSTGTGLPHNQSITSVDTQESFHSTVSWSAVLAGTAAAAALSLILIILGVGLGMSSLSVWPGEGIGTVALGITSIIWLTFTQIIAYGMGGYLAGRLRTKWVSVHSDEVYFRDTAHGFLTWALASLLCATLLASVISSIAGGATKAGATLIGGTASAVITGATSNIDSNAKNIQSNINPMNYMIGMLFRKDAANLSTSSLGTVTNESSVENNSNSEFLQKSNHGTSVVADQTSEVTSIFMNSINASTLPPSDVKYLGQIVAQQTGLSQPEAEKRVETTFATMKEKKTNAMMIAKTTADKTRKAAAYTALWFFVFLLIGAFSASLAATWGGRGRDN